MENKNEDNNKKGRNKGGPPKKEILSNNLIGFMVTKDEKEQILEDFAKSNYTKISHYLKNIVLNKQCDIIYIDKTKEELLKELHKIGTNINQIARFFNSNIQDSFTQNDKNVLDDFKNIYLNLGKIIDK